MIKNLLSILLIIFIFSFSYFVVKEYLSDKNIKMINLNRSKDGFKKEVLLNLEFLKNDTDDVIEFNSGFNNDTKNKTNRNFWQLFETNK